MSACIRLAVLLGGNSPEREVSLNTGSSVINALRKDKNYSIRRFDPASQMSEFITAAINREFDVVFVALHGTGYEDGILQGLLESLKIPYTGSSVRASAIGYDKITTKRVLMAENISTAEGIFFEKDYNMQFWNISIHADQKKINFIAENEKELFSEIQEIIEEYFSYPLFLKPSEEGSTVGVCKAESKKEIQKHFSLLTKSYDRILLERALPGKEVTCSVLNGSALPLIEISTKKHSFYTYESKYSSGGSEHIIPAQVSKKGETLFRKVSEKIGVLLGTSGAYRVDGFIEKDSFWITEVNTLPGMTSTSLLPDAASAVGIPFEELCKKLIKDAVQKPIR
jgi:D-alanine-D-alanine ligase